MMWLSQTCWPCGHSPQNLCHFLSSARPVRPSESAPFSHSRICSRAAPLSRAALAFVVLNEDEPSPV